MGTDVSLCRTGYVPMADAKLSGMSNTDEARVCTAGYVVMVDIRGGPPRGNWWQLPYLEKFSYWKNFEFNKELAKSCLFIQAKILLPQLKVLCWPAPGRYKAHICEYRRKYE